MIKHFTYCAWLIIFVSSSVAAIAKTLPVPRYVTTKFNEVNVRTGPNKNCPIEWIFTTKGEPIEVVAEYDKWRKVRDIKGEGGWIHANLISGNRSVIFIGDKISPLLKSPGDYNKIVAKLTPQIRCKLNECKEDWCLITCKSYKGWIAKKFLWGVYPDE
jgi:SH3-like domain-containing protein